MSDKSNSLVRTSDSLKFRLQIAKDTSGLTWREIAKFDEFSPVPAGTLCAIYKGAEVPKKWRSRFGIVELIPAPVCPPCGIVHTTKRCTANDKSRRAKWVRVMGHQGWREL